MIPRDAKPRLEKLANQFPAVILLGPRQCGKTTLVRHFSVSKTIAVVPAARILASEL